MKYFLLVCFFLIPPMAAAEAPLFKAMPVTTPEQQSAINRYGNLAIANVLYLRCSKELNPPPSDAQKQSIRKLAGQSGESAKAALHNAYPLETQLTIDTYLAAYQKKIVEGANQAIDQNGCEDKRISLAITLLNELHRELTPAK